MSVGSSAPEAEEVSPQQAWQMLKEMRGTKLVDVRTVPEWLYVGLPEIEATDGSLLQISWHVFPDMTMNAALSKTSNAPRLRMTFFCLCAAVAGAAWRLLGPRRRPASSNHIPYGVVLKVPSMRKGIEGTSRQQ